MQPIMPPVSHLQKSQWILLFCGMISIILGAMILWTRHQRQTRRAYIERYAFKTAYYAMLLEEYPELSTVHLQLIAAGLKTFFKAALSIKPPLIYQQHPVLAMPSAAVDALWHIFILDTRAYHQFCQLAFGRYLHHTPVGSALSPAAFEAALERLWRLTCQANGQNPTATHLLPQLFALDKALGILNGQEHNIAYLKQLSQFVDEERARVSSGSDGGSIDCDSSSDTGCSSDGGCGGGCGGD
jgi:hypothetical protein